MYDGMNEKGLCCGALAFTGNSHYNKYNYEKYNITSYDFVSDILSNVKTVYEAKKHLEDANIDDEIFDDELHNTDLHWFICDKNNSIVVEQTSKKGLMIYDNIYDVLTNNPPYPDQVSECIKANTKVGVCRRPVGENYTRGTETYGLSGDLTSKGRFQRASYHLSRLRNAPPQYDGVVNTFHILSTVEQPYGSTPVNKQYEYTIYSVVYDMKQSSMIIKKYGSLEYIEKKLSKKNYWREKL